MYNFMQQGETTTVSKSANLRQSDGKNVRNKLLQNEARQDISGKTAQVRQFSYMVGTLTQEYDSKPAHD